MRPVIAPVIAIAFALCLTAGLARAEQPQIAKAEPGSVGAGVASQPAGITARPASTGVTRSVALRQIREQGLTVLRLAKDSEGNWIGEATRGTELMDVAVDAEGNLILW